MATAARGFALLLVGLALAWESAATDTANMTAPAATPTPTPTPTLSGCQLCASTADCSHAYLDGPGQYCGPWLDAASQMRPCCCPRDAACRLANSACQCSRNATPRPPAKKPTAASAPRTSQGGGSPGVGVLLGSLLLLNCCVGICWCGRRAAPRPATVFFGQPAAAYDVLPAYAKPGVVYAMAPVAPPAYGYGYVPNYGPAGFALSSGGRGGGGFASAGLGAVAGMGMGMVLANATSHDFSHHYHHHGYSGGYDSGGDGGSAFSGSDGGGGGGGGDFGGDF